MNSSQILILGASSDIGREVIRHLDDGSCCTIYAQYHNSREKIDQLSSGLSTRIVPICADMANETGVNFLARQIEADGGSPDKILHLLAPKVTNVRFRDLAWENVQCHLDLQVSSVFRVLNTYLPKMAKVKRGKVVFILSSYVIGTPPGALAHYITAKYALLGLMKALASEYATKNIQINAVSPSMVETGFLSEISEKIIELSSIQHPLKRNASPKDIAPLVKYLLSNESDYMTGINIPITGGLVF